MTDRLIFHTESNRFIQFASRPIITLALLLIHGGLAPLAAKQEALPLPPPHMTHRMAAPVETWFSHWPAHLSLLNMSTHTHDSQIDFDSTGSLSQCLKALLAFTQTPHCVTQTRIQRGRDHLLHWIGRDAYHDVETG